MLSRRNVILGATALGVGALIGFDQRTASALGPSTIVNASVLYVDFSSGQARKGGAAVTLSAVVSGTGVVRSSATNLLAPLLPFAGANIKTNKLPTGLSWHSATTPKNLIGISTRGIGFGTRTTPASPNYFGGVRTEIDVVRPGQTVLLSFKAGMSLNGNPNASLMVHLLRISDQQTTIGVRAYNAQEAPDQTAVVRLKAPAGGTDGYRLVFTGQAGASQVNQSANIYLSDLLLINEPAPAPTIGSRYALPPYFTQASAAQNVVLKPSAPAGTYFIVLRTDEFGWGAETVTLSGPQAVVDIKALFGTAVNMTIREIYVVPQESWQKNWLDTLSPTPAWIPARFMNINNSLDKSRPESPGTLSRMTGMPVALSAVAAEGNGNIPTLGAPATPWAAAYDATRLSHQAFGADTTHYIGDNASSLGIHCEIWPQESVLFDRDEWISFWTKTDTPILDANGVAVIFQYRYSNNLGDTSALSPELALEQLPDNRFQLRFRTDHGKPVLVGDSTAAGITTGAVDPVTYLPNQWNAVVVRVRFSKTGGGYLAFWFNGKKIFDQAVAVGYNRTIGPKLHYGTYKFSTYRHRVEFQHMEHGIRSLASRVASPLPV